MSVSFSSGYLYIPRSSSDDITSENSLTPDETKLSETLSSKVSLEGEHSETGEWTDLGNIQCYHSV